MLKKEEYVPGVVVHACNPSTLGGGDWRIRVRVQPQLSLCLSLSLSLSFYLVRLPQLRETRFQNNV